MKPALEDVALLGLFTFGVMARYWIVTSALVFVGALSTVYAHRAAEASIVRWRRTQHLLWLLVPAVLIVGARFERPVSTGESTAAVSAWGLAALAISGGVFLLGSGVMIAKRKKEAVRVLTTAACQGWVLSCSIWIAWFAIVYRVDLD